jgi:hypothetical protein
MATHTSVPNINLSPWYFSVRWAIHHVESSIAYSREHGFSTVYDEYHLAHLQELEQFLKMSWDIWMDELAANCPASAPEIPNVF